MTILLILYKNKFTLHNSILCHITNEYKARSYTTILCTDSNKFQPACQLHVLIDSR